MKRESEFSAKRLNVYREKLMLSARRKRGNVEKRKLKLRERRI
jgi:hypothetical protein